MEKYLKYILLVNRIEARKIGHDLSKGLKKIDDNASFKLQLSSDVYKFIEHLDTFGRHRYFETMYTYDGSDLLLLDKTIWEVRRYCQPIEWRATRADGRVVDLSSAVLRSIELARDHPPYKFRHIHGHLEKIISKRSHPARPALVWQNAYFGTRDRPSVTLPGWSGFANSPLSLNPQIVDEVIKYVFLPRDVVAAFRELAAERATGAGKRTSGQ